MTTAVTLPRGPHQPEPTAVNGIRSSGIDVRSGLHTNIWLSGNFDLSGSDATDVGVFCSDWKCRIQKVYAFNDEEIADAQEAVVELGIVGDANEFGTWDIDTDTSGAIAANTVTDVTTYLTETEAVLEKGEILLVSVTAHAAGGTGNVRFAVVYTVDDN
jgi:hypothetical protein